jgi:hypothetical protein
MRAPSLATRAPISRQTMLVANCQYEHFLVELNDSICAILGC